jgi:O-acetyl-ADP-ribose deacetylase (regulator of RNase III)
MKIIKGNILDMPNGLICHQVNCQGVMGAGLAYQIKKEYPNKVFQEYLRFCNENNYDVMGQTQIIEVGTEHYIANLFGQYSYGRGEQTNYNMLKQSLERAALFSVEENVTYVYIPYRMGAGLAGGNWDKIVDIVLDVEEEFNIEITAVKYQRS